MKVTLVGKIMKPTKWVHPIHGGLCRSIKSVARVIWIGIGIVWSVIILYLPHIYTKSDIKFHNNLLTLQAVEVERSKETRFDQWFTIGFAYVNQVWPFTVWNHKIVETFWMWKSRNSYPWQCPKYLIIFLGVESNNCLGYHPS
jgi:hypothetical protein